MAGLIKQFGLEVLLSGKSLRKLWIKSTLLGCDAV